MLTILNPQGAGEKADYTVCFTDENHAYDVQFNNIRSQEELEEVWKKYCFGRDLSPDMEAYAVRREPEPTLLDVIPDRRTPVGHSLDFETLMLNI